MSTRLTQDIRHRLLSKMLEHRFDKDRDALHKRKENLALEVYKDLYSPATIAAMKKFPEDAFPACSSIRVTFVDDTVCLDFPDDTSHLFFYRHTRVSCKVYEPRHAFSVEYFTIERELKALREEHDQVRSAGRATLNKVNTTRQLIEMWPEIEPFLKELAPVVDTPCIALAVPVDQLNKMFALPVETKAKPQKKRKAA